jgi:hypothetical protein
MLHEPAQFDWAAEVDKALGLSPIVHNAPQSMPVDPIPGNVAIDPVRILFTNPHALTPYPLTLSHVM